MLARICVLLAAYIIDRIIGDPRWLTHPVVYMGRVITWLEDKIRSRVQEERLKRAGLLFPIVLVAGSFVVVWALLALLHQIHPWLAWGVEAWLISTTIATKGLAEAGMEIYRLLKQNKIEDARHALSMVVGRDTAFLNEKEISRGAVETVAENIVDAIISPLFYATIGGAPLAMAYRAANTLDSMVGYKNEKYRNLGWASARFDDVVNYIPARLSALLLVFVSWILRLNWRGCAIITLRDARRHPSPNSGFTEAGVAGALGIQLGGTNYYQGVPSDRAKMGDALRSIVPKDIKETVRMMHWVSFFFLMACLTGILLIELIYRI
ncbi:adenosylcobinamide-phosphate synthase CbiB [Aneurinibacillus migulanus]|uniref:Cobalamin biosynthesis protein CobD n=1 Tax=Aneurinibacillus migulanus TaxID=47500 RepID=A0A0D1XTN5_ANEMI|nr:adenosylcobinamide-phosphate synthase CbiB [Aneurinibacillus migulanus]KIV57576.1 cobalamin biosynthesis protein [Aneurinibacillus migulanus]KON94802.1 cobalamin biosynthesis protein [Aneurinibacillus migulanus]MED0892945.1 adenosylcobinamide-phosphate synthase CbiB [Aneurinibacillus migulanus]MED1619191.1 adenosylcobinamide-phosphate synthase CbiB [Aneurinibacillus migulanus]SDI89706.1 adenosylcobinamide-phosphate synthase [Aneurinibacillus migulanus]